MTQRDVQAPTTLIERLANNKKIERLANNKNMFIDSHTHIQMSQFDKDRRAVIRRAAKAGVEKILAIGIDYETSLAAAELADEYDNVYATAGIHPHNAESATRAELIDIHNLAQQPKVLAFGEMGLDYYRNHSTPKAQKKVFVEQLEMAEALGMPIVIHNREAYHDILPILEALDNSAFGVMHCFTGNVELMHRCLAVGNLYIGIGGIVTYPKAADVHAVAREVPADRLLIETDCPWLAPQPWRGKRNEPAYVRAVAEKIAELRDTSVEELGKITSQNFDNLFAPEK